MVVAEAEPKPAAISQDIDVNPVAEPQEVVQNEIERRFLITKLPKKIADYASEIHTQGYTEEGIRYRMTEGQDGISFIRNEKSGKGIVREERELELGVESFLERWPETEGRRVKKTRFSIPYGEGVKFDIDIYLEDGIEGHEPIRQIVAEAEFDTERRARKFKPPKWFYDEDNKLHEVTGIKAFSNKSIAKNGWPQQDLPTKKVA